MIEKKRLNSKQEGNEETWRDIAGWEGVYQVSDHGRVRRHIDYKGRHSSPGRIFTASLCPKGYPQVGLHRAPKTHTIKIHRLVAAAFLGPRQDGMQVNHIDGCKTNNHIDNLEYVTPSENALHALRLGLYTPKGRSVPKKLDPEKVREIRRRVALGESRKVLAKEFSVHVMTIGELIRGEIWRSVV